MKRGLAGISATLLFGGAAGSLLPVPVAGAENLACSATKCSFVSPNQSIGCVITVGAGPANPDIVFCGWTDGERSHTVKMAPTGALDPCINPSIQLAPGKCSVTPPTGAPILGYGQSAVLGPFTCLAEAQAISCTTAPSGKGFTFNTSGILPVYPPPPPPPPAPATPAPESAATTPAPAPPTAPAPAPVEAPPAPEEPAA